MLIFGLQHVISKSCFTDGLIVLCLDENAERQSVEIVASNIAFGRGNLWVQQTS